MTTIKKLGLTALAGSLVATSAYAGAVDVTGGASITYKSEDNDEVTGNPFSMGRGITFSGGGEMDNGWNVNMFYVMDDAAFSSSGISVDMGDGGTFYFDNGGGSTGVQSMKDKIPYAGAEQAYDDMTGDGDGLTSFPTSGTLGWKTDVAGYTVSAAYNKNGSTSTGGAVSGAHESSHSFAVSGTVADGLEGGIGWGDVSGASANASETQVTAYGKYAMGGATMAVQLTDIDKPAGTNDIDSMGYGITFAVNENFSIGLSRLDVDYNDSSKSDQQSTGFGASYTMGSMSVKGTSATTDSASGTSGSDDKHTEITLSFAF
jgi:outer membrane protein OmpU|tara:strand:+ start:23 stop:976 length:954 start_codon:yes stop_codon:yes gene_type:complete